MQITLRSPNIKVSPKLISSEFSSGDCVRLQGYSISVRVLLDHFTQEQHARFEAYRRSALNKNSVRKVSLLAAAVSILSIDKADDE